MRIPIKYYQSDFGGWLVTCKLYGLTTYGFTLWGAKRLMKKAIIAHLKKINPKEGYIEIS